MVHLAADIQGTWSQGKDKEGTYTISVFSHLISQKARASGWSVGEKNEQASQCLTH